MLESRHLGDGGFDFIDSEIHTAPPDMRVMQPAVEYATGGFLARPVHGLGLPVAPVTLIPPVAVHAQECTRVDVRAIRQRFAMGSVCGSSRGRQACILRTHIHSTESKAYYAQ